MTRAAWLLGLLLAGAAPPGPPRAELGEFALSVVATGRVLALDADGAEAGRVVVTCRLDALQPGAAERVLDPARGVTLQGPDETDYPLVRVQPRGSRPEGLELDLVFAGTPPAGATVTLRGSVVSYRSRREFAVEVTDLAQPVGALGTVGEVSLRVERLARVRVGEEPRWHFLGLVERVSRPAADTTWWGDDRLELLDSEGMRWTARGLRIAHVGQGRRETARLDAFFPLPDGVQPAALRYQCMRYEGVTEAPFEFTGLPLP